MLVPTGFEQTVSARIYVHADDLTNLAANHAFDPRLQLRAPGRRSRNFDRRLKRGLPTCNVFRHTASMEPEIDCFPVPRVKTS